MTGTIYWNGVPVPFQPGDTLAQALGSAGIACFGVRSSGLSRGVFCGIGQCQNCLVRISGRGVTEACLTPCRDDLRATALEAQADD